MFEYVITSQLCWTLTLFTTPLLANRPKGWKSGSQATSLCKGYSIFDLQTGIFLECSSRSEKVTAQWSNLNVMVIFFLVCITATWNLCTQSWCSDYNKSINLHPTSALLDSHQIVFPTISATQFKYIHLLTWIDLALFNSCRVQTDWTMTCKIAWILGVKPISKSRWNWPLLEYVLIVCITACLKNTRRRFALSGLPAKKGQWKKRA